MIPRNVLLLPAAFLLLLPFTRPAPAATPQGAPQRLLLHADGAWLEPGRRIAPAWVLVEDGVIRSVSTRRPRAVARVIEVPGTLVPGIVDAWSGLLPGDLRAARSLPAWADVRDSLPVDLPGADPEFSARVGAARRAGVAAVFLASPTGLQAGISTAASFTSGDLLEATGRRFLEIRMGSVQGAALGGIGEIGQVEELFEAAQAAVEASEEYQKKLEKYEEDLEEYQKKLEEFAKKRKEAGKEGKDDGKGGAQRARAARREGNGKEAQGKDEAKKPEPPKRPRHPAPPKRNPAVALAVQAIQGDLPVRFAADGAAEIRRVLDWKRQYGLRAVIAGGREADLLAEELAMAEIPVVLIAGPDLRSEDAMGRGLPARWRALRDAGVEVALASGEGPAAEQALLLHAGRIVAAGAPVAEVWASLTSVPARILGLSASHGRIARGARADLLAFGGRSPFDFSASFRAVGPQGLLP